ncbi:MAG TPA: hypothetical protein VIF15_13860 [Polyangiaceae bacterium]
MTTRRLAVVALGATLAACAPLLDFDALTGGGSSADAGGEDGGDAGPDTGGEGGGDAGQAGDAGDPCTGVPAIDNGFYCGGSTENGFAGGSADALYACEDGGVANVTPCPSGCVVAPPGYPDTCDECASKHDGAWCGREFFGFQAILANVVFQCAGGKNAAAPVACGGATPTCQPRDGGATCVP